MIELVCIYCLIGNGSSCLEKRVPMENFQSPAACSTAGQERALEYVMEHPKYRLVSWRCEIDVPKQSPA